MSKLKSRIIDLRQKLNAEGVPDADRKLLLTDADMGEEHIDKKMFGFQIIFKPEVGAYTLPQGD